MRANWSAFTGTIKVVHGERRHSEVEVALGQWVLETAHREIGSGDGCGRGNKDLYALVDADQLRLWTDVEHPTGRLPPTPSSSTGSTWIPAVALPTASCSSSYAGTSARIVSR